jgi:hypothetical protein
VLLAYVDESFSDDWYFMAALLCDGPGVQAIAAGLDDVVENAVQAFGVSDDSELHGYELFQGKGWWAGTPPRARINVYRQAFEVIAKHGSALILRGMNTPGFAFKYGSDDRVGTHSVVLHQLLEQVNSYALSTDDHVPVIADEVGEQSRHRSSLASYRRYGTPGYLNRVVDTLHFAPSNASRMIQAIDLVTFLYRRTAQHVERDARAKRANEALWEQIQPLIAHSRCWLPL